MKNIKHLSLLFLLFLQFSCNKDEEDKDPVNQDIDLTLAYEEDFTSGIHQVNDQNNWAATSAIFTDTGATYYLGGANQRNMAGYRSMSALQTPDDVTYGASITFRFHSTSSSGSFGFIFTANNTVPGTEFVRVTRNTVGGTILMVNRAGYAVLYDSKGGTSNRLFRLGSGGLFYVGHLMDADDDITLSVAVNDNYIAYYVNGHKVYEQGSFVAAGRDCGIFFYPPASVTVKNFRTYD